MNKKASAIVIFLIILAFIIIVVIVGALLFIGTKHPTISNSKNQSANLPIITVYLSTKDSNTGSIIQANYLIFNDYGLFANGQTTANSYNPILVNVNKTISVSCYNSDHYLSSRTYQLTQNDINNNVTKIDCLMPKIGNLKINKVEGNIQLLDNIMNINLTSENGEFHKLGACFSYTAGITQVNTDNNNLVCNQGMWLNTSNKDEYFCGKDIEKCKSVIGINCITKEITVPDRFKRDFDVCKYFGYDLTPTTSQTINLDIKTYIAKNSLDNLKMVFFDYDQRFISGNFTYIEEIDNADIGSTDKLLTINYKSE